MPKQTYTVTLRVNTDFMENPSMYDRDSDLTGIVEEHLREALIAPHSADNAVLDIDEIREIAAPPLTLEDVETPESIALRPALDLKERIASYIMSSLGEHDDPEITAWDEDVANEMAGAIMDMFSMPAPPRAATTYYHSLVQFDVLSEEPIDGMSLEDIVGECQEGPCLRNTPTVITETISRETVERLCVEYGSDENFFEPNAGGECPDCAQPLAFDGSCPYCDDERHDDESCAAAVAAPEQSVIVEAREVVTAEAHSDDRLVVTRFNARPWLEGASDDEIKELAACGWGGDYPADAVARDSSGLGVELPESRDTLADLFAYIEKHPTSYGATVGFECNVDETQALAWLATHNPELHTFLTREGDDDAPQA